MISGSESIVKSKELDYRWIEIYDNKGSDDEVLIAFFDTDNIYSERHLYIRESSPKNISYEASSSLCTYLLEKPLLEIFSVVLNNKIKENLSPRDIPQFSNFLHGTIKIVDILSRSGDFGMTFNEAGEYLTHPGKKTPADIKYGENHSKLAELLGLVIIKKKPSPSKVFLSPVGCIFHELTHEQQELLISRLILRIPVVQSILLSAKSRKTNITNHLQCLSKTTILRRKPNVIFLINYLLPYGEGSFKALLNNIERY